MRCCCLPRIDTFDNGRNYLEFIIFLCLVIYGESESLSFLLYLNSITIFTFVWQSFKIFLIYLLWKGVNSYANGNNFMQGKSENERKLLKCWYFINLLLSHSLFISALVYSGARLYSRGKLCRSHFSKKKSIFIRRHIKEIQVHWDSTKNNYTPSENSIAFKIILKLKSKEKFLSGPWKKLTEFLVKVICSCCKTLSSLSWE